MTAADGSDWFIHFQSRGLYGRVTHLQPMAWQADGWPIIGEPVAGETYGTPGGNVAQAVTNASAAAFAAMQ